MIVQGILQAVAAVWSWFMSILPTFDSLDTVTGGMVDAVSTLTGYAANSGAWIPWVAVGVSLLLVSSTLAASLGLKLGFKILSLFTGGGGAG